MKTIKTQNKKTITVTSLALLIATISAATTMTMVQADSESGLVATFGPNGGTDGVTLNTVLSIVMNHDYADVTDSVDNTYTNSASLPGGYIDANEPLFQDDGFPLLTADGSFTLYLPAGGGAISPSLSFIKGHEEANYAFDSLNADSLYEVTVDISDMDDTGLFLDPLGVSTPALETVFVTANSVDLGSVVADIGAASPKLKTKTFSSQVERADGLGDLVVGFNEQYVWDPNNIPAFPCANPSATLGCPGSQSGIRVEQITLLEKTGDVDKAIIDCGGEFEEIEIKQTGETTCTFSITYTGDSAVIVDTVNAEWEVLSAIEGPSLNAQLLFTDGVGNGAANDMIDHLDEISINDSGFNVPDGAFTFAATTTVGTINFADANNDRQVQANELSLGDAGEDVLDAGTADRTANAVGGDCTIDVDEDTGLKGKNKKQNMKSATGITCDAEVDDIFAIITIETRESPDTKKTNPPHSDKANKYKPTSCGTLYLNEDGAAAILLDPEGNIVLTGEPPVPAILDTSNSLSVDAIENLPDFECEIG